MRGFKLPTCLCLVGCTRGPGGSFGSFLGVRLFLLDFDIWSEPPALAAHVGAAHGLSYGPSVQFCSDSRICCPGSVAARARVKAIYRLPCWLPSRCTVLCTLLIALLASNVLSLHCMLQLAELAAARAGTTRWPPRAPTVTADAARPGPMPGSASGSMNPIACLEMSRVTMLCLAPTNA